MHKTKGDGSGRPRARCFEGLSRPSALAQTAVPQLSRVEVIDEVVRVTLTSRRRNSRSFHFRSFHGTDRFLRFPIRIVECPAVRKRRIGTEDKAEGCNGDDITFHGHAPFKLGASAPFEAAGLRLLHCGPAGPLRAGPLPGLQRRFVHPPAAAPCPANTNPEPLEGPALRRRDRRADERAGHESRGLESPEELGLCRNLEPFHGGFPERRIHSPLSTFRRVDRRQRAGFRSRLRSVGQTPGKDSCRIPARHLAPR